MSSYQHPVLHRKSSAPWDRLRPIKQDPLESIGFVSKGDTRLLNIKSQESYYHKITARYMQFCAQHSRNLDDAFAALSIDNLSAGPRKTEVSSSSITIPARPATAASSARGLAASKYASTATAPLTPDPADELSTILMSLRKLREGILATSASAPSPVFSQRVHVFNIRLAILALHPESYHASLRYLLGVLHTKRYPLPCTELREMFSYLILDTALRLGELNEAYSIRYYARRHFDYNDLEVDRILRAVVSNDWPMFWKVRSRVDGYVRAILHWKIESFRRAVLKTIGKSYMRCDVGWILKSSTGGGLSWEELIQKEDVGWLRDGRNVIIRKPKSKG